MNGDRISKLEEELQPPAGDLNLIVRYENSTRGSGDILIRTPDETPFPEGFKVTHESTAPDGSVHRVWHPIEDRTPPDEYDDSNYDDPAI
jgi:hypothetical protein